MDNKLSDVSDNNTAALPKVFVLELTRRCNNNCGYCYNVWRAPESTYDRECPREMTTREVKETIAKLQNDAPVAAIALSGGEPTLRHDIPEIIKFIRSCGMKTLLVTNGTLLTEELVEATIQGGGMYEIPLLSHQPEVHDRLVGRTGAWDAVIEGMMNVHSLGGYLSVVFVATRQNWNDLYATTQLAMLLGANEFLYKRVNVGAANITRADELFLTPAMIEQNLKTLDQFAAKYEFRVSSDGVIPPCILDTSKFRHVSFGWCPLAGENAAFVIDPSGNIRICEHSPKILGNIRHDRFRDIYHHPYVEAFRTTCPQECENCQSSFKDRCRGGCKAAAEQTYGTFNIVDPFVRLNQ